MSQSILIIGAGPGIGQSAAERFGREGWTVILSRRDAQALEAQVAELAAQGIDAHGLAADATDPVAVRELVAAAARITGALDVVSYNAATIRLQDLFGMSDAEVADDLAINIAGGLYTIRAAVAQFGDRGGAILVTSGSLAVAPMADFASLGLGKAALRNLVQGLVAPLAERNIRIAMPSIATQVLPSSAEAAGAAELLWTLATDPSAPWEATYP
jgi:NAD(P)-dependent dehydrogenase (short-subunit alcohol dehydrogenase family)